MRRIDACGKAKQVVRALELFDELVAAGNVRAACFFGFHSLFSIPPPARFKGCAETFSPLVLRLAQVPDAVTYTALIDACGRAGMLDQAFALFARCAALEHIRACTSPPFFISSRSMPRVLSLSHSHKQDARRPRRAQPDHIQRANPRVRSGRCDRCRLPGLAPAAGGRTDEAQRAYIHGAYRRVLQDGRARRVVWAVVSGMRHPRTHTPTHAFSPFALYPSKQMVAEGVEPSRVTFDIMLRASCVANAPQRFYELKGMIEQYGVELSEATVQLINDVDTSLSGPFMQQPASMPQQQQQQSPSSSEVPTPTATPPPPGQPPPQSAVTTSAAPASVEGGESGSGGGDGGGDGDGGGGGEGGSAPAPAPAIHPAPIAASPVSDVSASGTVSPCPSCAARLRPRKLDATLLYSRATASSRAWG